MKKIFSLAIILLTIIPGIALAAVTDFRSLLQLFADLLGSVIGVLYMVAFATFFWGIGLFILNTTDDKKRQEGKAWMFWSVIALFVMITIWGLVGVLVNTVGISPLIIPQLPNTP
jgi:hypothetical protein